MKFKQPRDQTFFRETVRLYKEERQKAEHVLFDEIEIDIT